MGMIYPVPLDSSWFSECKGQLALVHCECKSVLLRMESSKTQSQGSASVPKNPAMSSCRKKKSDDVTFLEDLKDHIDEFIHASMDEHKHCFKNTIQKMFGMSKVVAERSAEAKEAEVESALPLQTSVSQ
ncbi:hypothetical protein OsJ_26398 [Oryza sativa Japonica Group]|uniref:Uncharacterized protein n=1 Tax=Oryza sativa subsp. japonica TaxID=39947 RepID=Q6ZCE2_ORYSJ|nr:hypothetical protein OsJ_26398 [Oryza sativa Japonica Group]BAD05323.1 hypothetical protein [Oryza sativa Japonica Group]